MSSSQPQGIHEDELPEGYPYDEMFPFSWVDIVRMFPSQEFVRGYLAAVSKYPDTYKALRNIRAYALKMRRKMPTAELEQIIIFCEDAGVTSSLLREQPSGSEQCDQCGTWILTDDVIKSKDDTRRLCMNCGDVGQ